MLTILTLPKPGFLCQVRFSPHTVAPCTLRHRFCVSDLPAARAALKRSIDEFADISGDIGVQICIENMPNWECFLFRQPDIDLDGTGLVLDTGHANTTGTLNEFIKYDIAHFHLHDNHGEKDEHMWIGGGNIDFSSLHEVLKKSRGIKVLEHRNGEYIEKSIAALKKMGIK